MSSLCTCVGAPRFAGAANGQFVKTLIDGVITALHAHGDASTAPVVAERLANRTALPAPVIARLLMSEERAALGPCRRLLVVRGGGVQCQPQDERISALRIEVDRTATSWTLSGTVVDVAHASPRGLGD